MGTQPYSPAQPEATSPVRTVIVTLIFACLIALFVRLGFWQLDRAQQKIALQTAFTANYADVPLHELPASEQLAELRFRHIELEGRYEPQRQVLLDGIVSNGRVGYEVLTPLRTPQGLVLVNRGWIAAGTDRSTLPDITVSDDSRRIRARLNRLPEPGIRLNATDNAPIDWPLRMLYPDQQALSDALGEGVPNYQLILNATEADGYQRDWKAVQKGPNTNYAYAFQWYAFALLGIVLYIIVLRRMRRTDPND